MNLTLNELNIFYDWLIDNHPKLRAYPHIGDEVFNEIFGLTLTRKESTFYVPRIELNIFELWSKEYFRNKKRTQFL